MQKSGNSSWPACLNDGHTLKEEGQILFYEENTQNINILMFSMPEEQILFNKAVGAFLFNWVYSWRTPKNLQDFNLFRIFF